MRNRQSDTNRLMTLYRSPRALTFLCLALMAALPTVAQDSDDRVKLHGFGGWAAGDTDGNEYLAGAEDREYDSITFALAANAEVGENLAISAQIFSESEDEEITTELEYAFAEWTFTDQLKLRGGLVKQPFGIYTEVFDVGTIRPFFDLPQGIYGPAEITAEAYQGLGVTGFKQLESGWGFQYDAYGGEIGLDSTEAANSLLFEAEDPLFGQDADEEPEQEEKIKDVLGGRLQFHSPGGNWTFGVSAYFGEPEDDDDDDDDSDEDDDHDDDDEEMEGEEASTTHEVIGVHLQYLTSDWSVRLEYAHRNGGDDRVETDAAYLEVARYFGQKWQVAGRYDWAEVESDEGEDLPATLGEHEDRALSLNYWFSPNLVFKLSYHLVEGNLYATADDLDELEDETRLIQLGVQFSF